MFNPDDYNDNKDYCQYVYEKNQELDLGLNSKFEIQFVANNYKDEIIARRGFTDEIYKSDEILNEVVKKLRKKQKFHNMKTKTADEIKSIKPIETEKTSQLEESETSIKR